MDIKRELFQIFQNNKDQFTLYERITEFIERVIEETKGEENEQFYEVVIHLLDSINNAGCEDRRSQQIQLLWDTQSKIINKYEKFLP